MASKPTGERQRRPPAPAALSKMLKNADISNDELVNGLLVWTLWHALNYPELTGVGAVATVIDAAAKFRAAGGGDDGGMAAFLADLQGAALGPAVAESK